MEAKEAKKLLMEEQYLLRDCSGDDNGTNDNRFSKKCTDLSEAIGMAADALEEKENMRNTFLWSLRREINMICATKLSDAEAGCLFFSGAIRSMSFLSGMLTVAQTLDILTFEEWEEYNAALMEIEREMYDMAR